MSVASMGGSIESPIGTAGAARVAYWRVAAIAGLFLLWEGVIPALLSMPRYFGQYAVAALTLAYTAMWLLKLLLGRSTPSFLVFVVLVFAWYFCVSAISSTFIFGYSTREWLFAQFFIVPILVPVMLHSWQARPLEVVHGLVAAGLVAASLTVGAGFGLDALLGEFQRRSVYEIGHMRTVILKNEIAFSAIYMFFHVLLNRRHLGLLLPQMAAALLLLYVMLFLMDSRLALVAVLLAVGIGFLLFRGPAMRRLPVFFLGLAAAILILPELYDKYVGSLDLANYIEAGNIQVRFDELAYFWSYFERTGGLGYGVFSYSLDSTNFAAWAAYNMIPGYTGFGVQDIAIFGSLVQFGWIGLAVTLFATFWCIRSFYKVGRDLYAKDRVIGIAGFSFMLGFMLSPWPMDFFTLNWTILLGWTMLYLAWKTVTEGQSDSPTTAGQPPL
jgi:hypothetical protein